MNRSRWTRILALSLSVAVVSGAAALTTTASAKPAASSPIKVGIIYSRTGTLSWAGAQWIQGFKLGIQYATNGTNSAGGHPLAINITDDGTDVTKGVTAAKDLIGQGYKIIGGVTSSGLAAQVGALAQQNNVLFVAGSAFSDSITGLNRNTFRSGRQATQEVLAATHFLPKGAGKHLVILGEDIAGGVSNADAIQKIFTARGYTVSRVMSPFNTPDMTPFAQQVKNMNPDIVYVTSWGGTNYSQMWQAVKQQGLTSSVPVITSLAQRATYQQNGPLFTGLKLISHYVYNAPKNKVNDWLVSRMRRLGQVPDIFTPDGFVTAELIVHAIQKTGGSDNVGDMIAALEGYQFLAPKGIERVRPEDHALTQPIFEVQLVKGTNGKYDAKVLNTISPGNTSPPITTHW